MGFLDNYEDVAARIARLNATYPNNRIETVIREFNPAAGYILVECRIWKDINDIHPTANDFAFGRVEAYNPSMKRWFVEDTVTSSIGRCAGILLGVDKRPTLQNMQAVETMPQKFVSDPWEIKEEGFTTAGEAVETIKEELGGELIAESPICKHGHMILKEGKKANGDAYRGYLCPEKVRANQCPAKWQIKSTTTGEWRFQ